MRVFPVRDQCPFLGVCWPACPDFFERNLDEDGSRVVEPFRIAGHIGSGDGPEEPAARVSKAAEESQAQMIRLEE